jgi:hypothetical protein
MIAPLASLAAIIVVVVVIDCPTTTTTTKANSIHPQSFAALKHVRGSLARER